MISGTCEMDQFRLYARMLKHIIILALVMSWCLLYTKPLPEPMLTAIRQFPMQQVIKMSRWRHLCFSVSKTQWWYITDMFVTSCVLLYPRQRSWGGTGFTSSVCPSVRPSVCRLNCVRPVSSTVLARPISYLHILSTNVRGFVACWDFYIPKFELLPIKKKNTSWLSTSCSGLLWMSTIFLNARNLVWIDSMGNHGVVGYSQNAGVALVVIGIAVIEI